MKATWIMQTNMGESSDIMDYVKAVKDSGANVIKVQYLPFSEEVPILNVSGPIVIYGSVNFVKAMQKTGLFSGGIFSTEETFTYESWAKNYNELLLNSPDNVCLTTIGEFSNDFRHQEEYIFVRPQNDDKSISGKVYLTKEFKDWCLEAAKGCYAGVNNDTPIVVAKPYKITDEYRLFVVNNQIVGSSQYFKNGKLFKKEGAPYDVLEFATKVIQKFKPAPIYTLDICKSAGNCYIMEVQSFNSAGAYNCDMVKVASAVNDFVITNYNSKLKNKL